MATWTWTTSGCGNGNDQAGGAWWKVVGVGGVGDAPQVQEKVRFRREKGKKGVALAPLLRTWTRRLERRTVSQSASRNFDS